MRQALAVHFFTLLPDGHPYAGQYAVVSFVDGHCVGEQIAPSAVQIGDCVARAEDQIGRARRFGQ